MIASASATVYHDGPDAWMALPLFNRNASPDHTRNVLDWEPTPMDFDIPALDCGFFNDFEIIDYDNLTPSHSSDSSKLQSDVAMSSFPFDIHTPSYSPDSSRPQSEYIISPFQSDSGYEPHHVEQARPSSSRRRSLVNEISDEYIPQPVFASPCQCTFPNCKSTTVFTTGRDFRRHYRQHFKRFFCRYEECPQSTDDPGDAGTKGFATRKDRARHEAKHNPAIKCPWRNQNGGQCTRTFSRMDNMKDHYRRIHDKGGKT